MGSLTGFYSIFRLNVNLFIDNPMHESSFLFNKSEIPIRSDIKIKKKVLKPTIKPKPVEKVIEQKEEIDENEELKRKSIANFKRSKSKHIINQYGQVVGKESDPSETLKNKKIVKPKSKSDIKKSGKQELAHNIFAPEDTFDDYIDDLYGTENTFELKHVSYPKPKDDQKKQEVEEIQLPDIACKTTMKLDFTKQDVDKPYEKIPNDFEIVFNFRCTQVNKQWEFEWEELEVLRNEIIKKLQENPELGNLMINGQE